MDYMSKAKEIQLSGYKIVLPNAVYTRSTESKEIEYACLSRHTSFGHFEVLSTLKERVEEHVRQGPIRPKDKIDYILYNAYHALGPREFLEALEQEIPDASPFQQRYFSVICTSHKPLRKRNADREASGISCSRASRNSRGPRA